MFLLVFFFILFFSIVIGIVISKKNKYKKLDKLGIIFNIILSILYIPISLYGVFSVFFADSMDMYSKTIQNIIYVMITVGVRLPFISVFSIVLSVILRKKGKRILGFIIQFIPLILFIIMIITFEFISHNYIVN